MANQNMEKELLEIVRQFQIDSGVPHQSDIRMDASLQRHLGIDSLGRAELFQRIEKKFSVSIPDTLLASAQTLQDIAEFLEHASPSGLPMARRKRYETHGERPKINLDEIRTLLDLPLVYGKHSPDKVHIYFQKEDGKEETITYQTLLQNSLRVAQALTRLGLKAGETIAIMQPTQPGFFYTFLGALLAGGIPVPIYPPFRMHMLEVYARVESRILKNAEVRILVTFDQAEKLSHLLKTFVPSLKHVTTVEVLLEEQTPLATPFQAQPHHFAFIQYTSGSTSDPKGVLLSHENLIANIRAYGKAINVQSDDVAVSWLPLYHDMGLIAMWLGSLYYGIPLVLLTPFSFLNHPEKWLWAIHYHRGTLSGAPNFAYELCVRKIEPATIEGLDLSSWRMAANGAEKIYPRTLNQFAEKFAPYGFKKRALLPVYGLAESTVGLAIPPTDRDYRLDHVIRKVFEEDRRAISSTATKNGLTFVSCGKPLEGHEIRIVDDEMQVLPERHVGSLEFRGPSNMQGYYNNPGATAAIYHDGWLNSGDLAYLADGEVYITGRQKDLIIKAGRNLYPVEIEELVGNIKGVRQGCVVAFGITDQERGTEKLIVVAESRVKGSAERKAIIAEIGEVVATNLDIVPDNVVLVAPHTVPKTSSGKLQRAACKKMFLNGQLHRFHMPPWMQIVRLSLQGLVKKIMAGSYAAAKLIYSAYALLIFLITFLPVYPCVLFGKREFAAKVCQIWARCLPYAIFSPVKIFARELLHSTTPVIYTANHASYIDSFVLLGLLPTNTRFIGKKELQNMPIIKTFVKKLEYICVDRLDFAKGIADTKRIQSVLQQGYPILIFPEGTFAYAQGLRPFRLGAFKIAAETHTPIIPIALNGTRAILRDDEKLLQPQRIQVTVCPAIQAASEEWHEVTELRNQVRGEIAKYCGEPSLDFIVAHPVAPKGI